MAGRISGCLILCAMLAGVSLQAHNSLAGVYDMKKETELSGSVEKVQFVNPHGSLTIAVKNADGTMTNWVLTLGSATALAQRGIGKPGRNRLPVGTGFGLNSSRPKTESPLGSSSR